MSLVREDGILTFDGLSDVNFIDSPDVKFSVKVVPLSIHHSVVRNYFLERLTANENTYVDCCISNLFTRQLPIISIATLENPDKYLRNGTRNLCPIEYVIARFSQSMCTNSDAWMFAIKRNEYYITIVSGIGRLPINKRTIKISKNFDLIAELRKTKKFINRSVRFENINLITNVSSVPECEFHVKHFNKAVNQKTSDPYEFLLKFAKNHNIHKAMFGKNFISALYIQPTKFFIALAASFCICLVSFVSFRLADLQYTEAVACNQTASSRLLRIFPNIDTAKQCLAIYRCVNSVKSPLHSISKLSCICDASIQSIHWTKDKIVIKGDDISGQTAKNIGGKIIDADKKTIEISI